MHTPTNPPLTIEIERRDVDQDVESEIDDNEVQPLSPSTPTPVVISPDNQDIILKFQLIPTSDGKPAFGEVVDRTLQNSDTIKLGRQIMRDGQATIKGTKKATDLDIWFLSKVVSRLHAEIWMKAGELYVKDVGSSSGTFLNGMRLSPTGKDSRPYPLKQGDLLQFGVDFKGKTEDVYRAVTMRLDFHDQEWVKAKRKNANPQRFSDALKQLIVVGNPSSEPDPVVECCICIGAIAPFQALFIAPCSHVYHFKCVGYLVAQSPMFQCPMCRQIANLTASVSSDSLDLKLVMPLPVLGNLELMVEEEIDQKKRELEKMLEAERKPRVSLSGGKRILETLGIHHDDGPKSPGTKSPTEDKKKRRFSFLRGFAGRSDREEPRHTPEEGVTDAMAALGFSWADLDVDPARPGNEHKDHVKNK